MTKLFTSLAAAFALLVPAAAQACPSAACASGCSTSMSSYLAALGVGLLAGIGSVRLERFWKTKG
jgi:hypothetical protein